MIKGVESEIKLLASEEMLVALRSHPLLAGDELCAELTTTYFDTHDGKLQRAGASLRLRSAGGHQEQTFKCPHAGSSSVRREEWSVPVSGAQPAPELFPPKPSAAILIIVAGDPLIPIAVVTVERCTRRLSFGASRIEAAFDVGTICANGQRQLVSELELELSEGRFADCLRLAAALPLGPDLCWSVRSKAERCYGLAGGATLWPKAPSM